MCVVDNYISLPASTELTKTVVLEEYTELLNDEEARVKQAALANLVLLFEVPLPEPTKVQQLHLPNLNTIPSAQRQMILWTSSSATAATKAASMAALPSFESPSTARRLSMLSGQGTSNTYGTQNTQTASAYGNAPRKSSLTAMSLNKLSGSNVSQSANVLPGAGSDIHGVLDIETKLTVVIPTWKKLCHEKSPALLPNLCEEFGKFMWCMKDIIKDEDVEWFITWYLKMAVSKDIVIRDMCSYNLPVLCFRAECA